MEMLKNKIVSNVAVVLIAGSIVWIVSTLIEVDKRTAMTDMKVSEINNMLKPLWEDFISRRNANGDVKKLDEQTDYKVHIKWK